MRNRGELPSMSRPDPTNQSPRGVESIQRVMDWTNPALNMLLRTLILPPLHAMGNRDLEHILNLDFSISSLCTFSTFSLFCDGFSLASMLINDELDFKNYR